MLIKSSCLKTFSIYSSNLSVPGFLHPHALTPGHSQHPLPLRGTSTWLFKVRDFLYSLASLSIAFPSSEALEIQEHLPLDQTPF